MGGIYLRRVSTFIQTAVALARSMAGIATPD